MSNKKHPMQPVYLDEHGVARFKVNPIVRYILDNGGITLNDIARLGFKKSDRAHFAQLIGYSVSGWGDLSYVGKKLCAKGDAKVEKLIKDKENDKKSTD